MFGPGPSEEIQLESKMAKHDPVDEESSKARYDDQLEHERDQAPADRQPSLIQRFRGWFSGRF